jgi:hypothetical protein
LNVAYASQRTVLSLNGDLTRDALFGAMIGFTPFGLVKGPIAHAGNCAPARPTRSSSRAIVILSEAKDLLFRGAEATMAFD